MRTLPWTIRLALLCLALSAVSTQAHPGRTDKKGCHTCRTNCHRYGLSTGQYHCHQSKTTAPAVPSHGNRLLERPPIRPSNQAWIRFEISPDDAVVYMDNQLVGIARDIHPTRPGIKTHPGKHVVIVFRPGFAIYHRRFEIQPGEVTPLRIKLQPTAPQ